MNIDFIVPGSIAQLTGGYIYDSNIIDGLQTLGFNVKIVELPGLFPFVDEEAKNAALRCSLDCPTIIDGLALPAFISHPRQKYLALIHHPLCKENGLDESQQKLLFDIEQKMLQNAHHIIVTSHFTREELKKLYATAHHDISVVCPGNTPKSILPYIDTPQKIELLCVANVCQRKGHDILLKALQNLGDFSWHLTCVGNLQRDPSTVRHVQDLIAKFQLESRVTLTGELSEQELQKKYAKAHVFVLASYYEGYGMALTEAINYGLPVVSTTGGAIPHVLGESALLVTPGNPQELAAALSKVISSPQARSDLRDKALQKRQELPSWMDSSTEFKQIIQKEYNVVF
ncbi:glycosyltransferase family 4 protein [Candidatus Uabimicrobium amorphum]|uniref:Glycosyl transferase n=1 Tax=Uabimicrobium amorphum TaxID=2596890 RepID=A0A5S9F428_UABAM|nr:glycosyltransferase family 4 protein [Candidatus Uabimicrobium amorphum]BBM84034.1 glycosyl transferase [Candidatus Uabimicrobium amorphum]